MKVLEILLASFVLAFLAVILIVASLAIAAIGLIHLVCVCFSPEFRIEGHHD